MKMTNKIRQIRKLILPIFTGVFVILGIFIASNLLKPQQTAAGWFDERWLYRKLITITNNTTEQTNVKINLSITEPSGIREDCKDLRFTDINGNILEFYQDTSVYNCGDGTIWVWILMPKIQANPQKTGIYMYYGNENASDVSRSANFSEGTFSNFSSSVGSEQKTQGPALWLTFDENEDGTFYNYTENQPKSKIKSVQRGTTTFSGATSTTATITPVDTSKSFVVANYRNASSSPDNGTPSWELTNSTTITFRSNVNISSTTIHWYVVEYEEGASVQRGNAVLSGAGATTDVTIANIDRNKSFPLISWHKDGSAYDQDDFIVADLTSNTNLSLECDTACNFNSIYWQVVTIEDAYVQKLTYDDALDDVAFSLTNAVNLDKSFLLVYNTSQTGTIANISQKMPNVFFQDARTVYYDKSGTNDMVVEHNIVIYVVELKNNIKVDHYTGVDMAAEDTSQAQTLNAYDINNSMILFNGYRQTGSTSTYTLNDTPGFSMFTISPTGTPIIEAGTIERALGINQPADDISFSVVEFHTGTGTAMGAVDHFTGPDCVSEGCVYLDGPDNTDYIKVRREDNYKLDTTSTLTVESWIKPVTCGTSGRGNIFSKKGSSGTPTYFETNTGSNTSVCDLAVSFRLTSGSIDVTASDAVNIGQWSHVAFTYEKSANPTIKLYVNGRQVGSGGNSSLNPLSDANGAVLIGWQNKTNTAFHGYIDEFKIYRHVRTAQQLSFAYKLGKTKETNTSAAFGEQNKPNISDGLIAHWKFDVSSGNVDNSVGDASNLTTLTNNATTPFTSGKFGNAANLTPANSQYFSLTDNPASTPDLSMLSGNSTYSVWIKPDSVSTPQSLISKWSSTNSEKEFILRLTNTGVIQLQVATNASGGTATVSATNFGTLSTGTWYHILAYYNAAKGEIGVSVNGTNPNTLSTSVNTGNASLQIGNHYNITNQEFFDGLIDEVRFYKKALSPIDIKYLYNYRPDPVFYVDLNEKISGDNKRIYDYSSSSRVLTTDNGGNGTGMDCTVQGKYGNACDFDGTDDVISISNPTGLPTGQMPRTISAWINADNSNPGGTILHYGNDSAAGQEFIISNVTISGSNYVFTDGVNVSNNIINTGAEIPTSGTWNHIVFTFDGGTGWKYYLNGLLVKSGTFAVTINTATPTVLNIGDRTDSAVSNFPGLIDEVKIFDYAFENSDVISDFNAGHPLGGSPISSMVGYWTFDERRGQTTYDQGYGDNDGTLGATTGMDSNDPVWHTNEYCKNNGCLYFDGVNDYVDVGNITDANLPSTGWSIAAWTNIDNLASSTEHYVISKHRWSSNLGYSLLVFNNGSVRCGFNGSSGHLTTAAGLIQQDTWYHLACVYDGTDLKIYIDGNQVTSAPRSLFANATSYNLVFGTPSDSLGNNLYTGNNYIDEIRIFTAPLSTDQIKLIMNMGSSATLGGVNMEPTRTQRKEDTGTTDNKPAIEWLLDENTGTTVYDTSGNGNNGTMAGTARWTQGRFGTAIDFTESSTAHVQLIGPTGLPNMNEPISISYWYKVPTNPSNTKVVVNAVNGTSSGIQCGFRSSNINCWKAGGTTLVNTTPPTAGQWHHVVYTFDGTTHTLYVNGIKSNTSTVAPNTGSIAKFELAYNSEYAGEELSGYIDQVRVYDYTLTPSQVGFEYQKGLPAIWYKMDECEGTTVYNSGHLSVNSTLTIGGSGTYTGVGTCDNGVSTDSRNAGTTGKFNSAIALDGSNDEIISASTFSPFVVDNNSNFINNISFGGWFYPTDNTDVTLIEKTNEFRLRLNSSGQPVCAIYYSGEFNNATASSVATSTSEWNHIMCVYNGATIKTYLNGIEVASSANTNNIVGDTTSLYIGRTASATERFAGLVDEIMIYSFDVSVELIRKIYNNRSSQSFR